LTLNNVTVNGTPLGNVQLKFGTNGLTQFADSGGTVQVNELQQNGFAAGQVNMQFRWAKIASAASGGTDTWQLFYEVNSTATGNAPQWQNAGTSFTFNSNGQMSPAIGCNPSPWTIRIALSAPFPTARRSRSLK
jgi:hypothetical protein